MTHSQRSQIEATLARDPESRPLLRALKESHDALVAALREYVAQDEAKLARNADMPNWAPTAMIKARVAKAHAALAAAGEK